MPADHIRTLIDTHAAENGDAVFLIAPQSDTAAAGTRSFAQLRETCAEIGRRLSQLGVGPGGKVAFLLDNGIWATQLMLGIMANNRVVVPINAVAGNTQLAHVLAHSDCEVIFVALSYAEKLESLLREVKRPIRVIETCPDAGPRWTDPLPVADSHATDATASGDTPALLMYTSGSTGLPKGALLTHRAVIQGGRNVMQGHALSPNDRALCVLPVYHINGAMVTVMAPLVSGGSVVMPPKFSARKFWSLIVSQRCTWASVVPTIINYLLDRAAAEPFDFGKDPKLAHFRFARSASAPLPKASLAQWEAVFRVPMIETLGLTETACTVASNPLPPALRKPGSVGFAYGDEIKIIARDTGADLPLESEGEIVIRGHNVLQEYYKDPENTAQAFANGWFRTGDLGKFDRDGYLFVTGRLKELIIRGGENIAPREVDDALYQHQGVLEAAAVGAPHRDYGQEVVAFVALRDGFAVSADELQQFCVAKIGEVKAPKEIYFLPELPKGPSGKILRLELAKRLAK